MSKKQDAKLLAMLGQAQQVARPSGVPTTRSDDEPVERVDVVKSKRAQGKRAAGYVQIAGLIPPDVRADLTLALAFDRRDLSELLTALLKDWLAAQPAHVQAAIKAQRRNV